MQKQLEMRKRKRITTGKTAFKNLAGLQFGRLTAISESPRTGSMVNWLCQCFCGQTKIVQAGNLRSGHTTSCGCARREIMAAKQTKHGMRSNPIYGIWCGMKARCLNSKSQFYKDYGGRGINICQEWLSSFEAFYKDMGDRPNSNMEIDRIDNNGNYCKENCRWATRKQQNRNTRANRIVEYQGIKTTLAELIEKSGMNPATFKSRFYTQKLSIEEIIKTPIGIKNGRK